MILKPLVLLPAGSSPDATTDDDDDEYLRQALALSMRTYAAEQQQQGSGQQQEQQQQEPARLLNKRSNSPAAAGPASADGSVAGAGTAVAGEDAAPAKKQRSSSLQWQPPGVNVTAAGAAQPGHANLSNLGSGQHGTAATAANAGVASQTNNAAALLLATSGLLALAHISPAAQLLALQQHSMQQQQQQPLLQQQQQLPAARGLLARLKPSPACGNLQQAEAAGVQAGMGRSGSVQDLGQLAGNTAPLAENTAPAAAADDDVDLYDLGDWVDDGDAELAGDDVASHGSGGGSGVAGMYAHYSAMQLNEQPQQQQQQQQQRQRPQQQQQQQQHLGLPRSGRGSASNEVGARRLYQQREPVWYVDPLFHTCLRGSVFGAEAGEQDSSSSGIGSNSRRYIVDLQCAAVRYVEATAAQLLPRLCVGDWVWCKPSMALSSQLGAATRLRMQQQRQQQRQQQQQQQQVGYDPWFGAEWVLGQVAGIELHGSVPVCAVRQPDGDICWFPNIHLEPVQEMGESSMAAETRGIVQQAAAAAELADVPAPAATYAPSVTCSAAIQQQQQRQQGQMPEPQQQQAEPMAGILQQQQQQQQPLQQQSQQQQQQQRAAEVPLLPSSGSGHCLQDAGSTGSVQCTGQASCGPAASPGAGGAGNAIAGAAVLMETEAADAALDVSAVVQGPGAVNPAAMQQDASMREAAVKEPCNAAAVDEEVADSSDLLLLLLPPAEGAGDSSEAAQGLQGKAGTVGQQPAMQPAVADVAVGDAAPL
jgi:hypothetical protein